MIKNWFLCWFWYYSVVGFSFYGYLLSFEFWVFNFFDFLWWSYGSLWRKRFYFEYLGMVLLWFLFVDYCDIFKWLCFVLWVFFFWKFVKYCVMGKILDYSRTDYAVNFGFILFMGFSFFGEFCVVLTSEWFLSCYL